jgi:hypothetical protein
VVDQNNQLVGAVVDPHTGVVLRKVGLDWLSIVVGPAGFAEGDIFFYHQQAGCGDQRLLLTSFTYGLVYPAQVHAGSIFYTKTLDPMGSLIQKMVPYRERFAAGVDASVFDPNACEATPTDMAPYPQSVGPVVTASDSAMGGLVAPFRVK